MKTTLEICGTQVEVIDCLCDALALSFHVERSETQKVEGLLNSGKIRFCTTPSSVGDTMTTIFFNVRGL